MSRQNVNKYMILLGLSRINVTTNFSRTVYMCKCKKRKLFVMLRQCRTPSKVAHVIRTLSQFTCHFLALI